VPWPESYSLMCAGSYQSEEGPVEYSLSLSCDLTASTIGSGAPIPWERIIREPIRPATAAPVQTGDTLSEGGDTSLRFNPQQALDRAREQSEGLSSFLREEVDISFSSMRYYGNGSIGPDEVVWNITLTSSRSTPDGYPYYVFAVAAPLAGGRLDLSRFDLIYEGSGYRFGSALRGRPLITLMDHERALKGCDLSAMFFSGTGYASSYELSVLDRTAFGTSASSTLLSNILGSAGSKDGDLFISYAEDPRDHRTAYIAVIDGKNGALSSLMTVTGGLSPYGAGLA